MPTLKLPTLRRSAKAQVQQAIDFGEFARAAAPDQSTNQRKRAPRVRLDPLERDVQWAILQLLARHPKVAFAGRFNSGAVRTEYAGKDGKAKRGFYRMNSIPGFSDIHGMLKGGRALYIEVKRRGEKPTDEQAAFLAQVVANGGFGMVADDVQQVADALEKA